MSISSLQLCHSALKWDSFSCIYESHPIGKSETFFGWSDIQTILSHSFRLCAVSDFDLTPVIWHLKAVLDDEGNDQEELV